MVVQIVRFKSGLSEDAVRKRFEERAPRFRALKGLTQKYYLRFAESGEHGAVYVWESQAALKEFTESELRRTIVNAYRVQGAPSVETAEVAMVLRPLALAEN